MAEQPMIVVRGEATREVSPELAVLTVTVSARDKDRQVALTQLTERAAQLRVRLDEFGVAIERRETGVVQVHPMIKHGNTRIAAYEGSVTTTVTVADFPVLGELLLRLADAEQTSVSGPWWQLRPGSRAGSEVRRVAIADALGRAREYAEAVGARVDRLIEIADDGTGGGGQPMMRTMALGGALEAGPELFLEIDPQQQTVHAAVIVRVTITEPSALT